MIAAAVSGVSRPRTRAEDPGACRRARRTRPCRRAPGRRTSRSASGRRGRRRTRRPATRRTISARPTQFLLLCREPPPRDPRYPMLARATGGGAGSAAVTRSAVWRRLRVCSSLISAPAARAPPSGPACARRWPVRPGSSGSRHDRPRRSGRARPVEVALLAEDDWEVRASGGVCIVPAGHGEAEHMPWSPHDTAAALDLARCSSGPNRGGSCTRRRAARRKPGPPLMC